MYLMQRLSSCVTTNIGAAIDHAMAMQLEPALRAAVQKQGRKDITVDLKAKLDQALNSASGEFATVAEAKTRQGAEALLHFTDQLQKEYMDTIQVLQSVVQQQQEQLAAYQNSGLLQEVESLRAQVKKLRESQASPTTAGPKAPSPETIVSTAKQFIDGKDYNRGLEWVLRFKNPELSQSLLLQLTTEQRDAIVEDSAVTNDNLAMAAAHVAACTDFARLPACIQWLDAILFTDTRDGLLSNLPLLNTVKQFVTLWYNTPGVTNELKKDLKRFGAAYAAVGK